MRVMYIAASGLPIYLHLFVSSLYLESGQTRPPLLASRHCDLHVQAEELLSCVHDQLDAEAYCTAFYESLCTDHHVLSYARDQLLSFQAAAVDPSLTSHFRELSVELRCHCNRSCRGGGLKQRWTAVVCAGATRLVKKDRRSLKSCPAIPVWLLPASLIHR